MKLSKLGPGLALCFVLTAPLIADTVYTYTGKDFSPEDVASPYTDLDYIHGEFTLSSPLADNMTFSLSPTGNVSPLSFSFSDGVQTLTNSDPLTIVDFDVATNSQGVITEWYFALGYTSCGGCGISSNNNTYFVEDVGDLPGNDHDGGNIGDPGTWVEGSTSPSSVPEPGNLVLLGFGLVATAVVRQRLRRRKA